VEVEVGGGLMGEMEVDTVVLAVEEFDGDELEAEDEGVGFFLLTTFGFFDGVSSSAVGLVLFTFTVAFLIRRVFKLLWFLFK